MEAFLGFRAKRKRSRGALYSPKLCGMRHIFPICESYVFVLLLVNRSPHGDGKSLIPRNVLNTTQRVEKWQRAAGNVSL